MKTIKIKPSGIVAFYFILLILSSCYTIKNETVVSTERIISSKTRLEGNYYNLKEKEKPGFESPYSVSELYQVGRYKYQTNQKVEQKKEAEAGTIIVGGVAIAGLSGWLFSNNTQWFSSETTSSQAFWSGAAIGGLIWWLVASKLDDKKTDYIYKPGIEYDFENEKLLTNVDILVSSVGKKKTFTSDANGLLKFSPSMDFNLNNAFTDSLITFRLKKDAVSFIDSLQLTPSDWMKRYAKIITPKTLVKEPHSQAVIGNVREGTIYEALKTDNDKVTILIGSKEGRIPQESVELFYATKVKNDYSQAIKSYVVEEMEKWLKQGEFELPEEYVKRLAKKNEQLLFFTNQAMDTFQKEYVSYFEWNKSVISRYNPNNQNFKIEIPELGEYVVNVPIANAESFKNNWPSVQFKNQKFTLMDGNWKLVSFDIEDPAQPFEAHYDSDILNYYDPTNQFAFDLKDFEVQLPDFTSENNDVKKSNENEIDDYSIKTDLPETSMSNPDAIAVVIGNTFYQKTAAVNFAINDAQLMKLYLTKVLGFKAGNIIFAMNTTKAELEGLFGTDKNYQGKLYNYIKPDLSDVFIFYSGHGAPDPNTEEAYFVPTDCDPSYVNLQGYALKTFYQNLAKLPAKKYHCGYRCMFSGAGVLKNISTVRIKPKDSEENIKNSAILSSSTGTQVSSWYGQKQHGLFTYFFLKAIHDYEKSDTNLDKKLTIKEIYEYVSDKTNGVPYYARRLNAVEQNPVLKGTNTERVLVKFGN
ncbi:MAG: caspase family protein [Chloroflexia bacterium]|nr:caspase family protein [Chloroflexia bacterium]